MHKTDKHEYELRVFDWFNPIQLSWGLAIYVSGKAELCFFSTSLGHKMQNRIIGSSDSPRNSAKAFLGFRT